MNKSSIRDRLEELHDKAKEFGNPIEETPKKKRRRDMLKRYKEKKKFAKEEDLKKQCHQPTEDFLLHVNGIKKQITKLRKLVNEIRIQQGKTFIVPKLDDNEMSGLESKCDEVYKQCYIIQSQIKELEGFTTFARGARHKICCLQSEFLIGQLKTIMDDFRLMQTGYVEKRKMDYRENWIINGPKTPNEVDGDNVVENNDAIELDQNRNSKKSKGKLFKRFKRSKSESERNSSDKTARQRILPEIGESEYFVEERKSPDKEESVGKGDKSSIRKKLTIKRKSITDFFDDGKRDFLSKEKCNKKLSEESESSDEDIDSAFDRYSKITDPDPCDEEPTESNTLKREKNRWSLRLGFKKIPSQTPERSLSQSSDQLEKPGSSRESGQGSHDVQDTSLIDSTDSKKTVDVTNSVENCSKDEEEKKVTLPEVTYSEFEESIDIEDSSTPNKNWSKKEKMKIPLLSSLRKGKKKKEKRQATVMQTDVDDKKQIDKKSEKLAEPAEIAVSKQNNIDTSYSDEGRQSASSQLGVGQAFQNSEKLGDNSERKDSDVFEDPDVFEESDMPNKNWSRKEKMKIPVLSSLRKSKLKKSEKTKPSEVSVESKEDKINGSNGIIKEITPALGKIPPVKDIKQSNSSVSKDVKIPQQIEIEKADKPDYGSSESSRNVVQIEKGDYSPTSEEKAVCMNKEKEIESVNPSKFFSISKFYSRKKKLSNDEDDESKTIPLLEQKSDSGSRKQEDTGIEICGKTIEDVPDVVYRKARGKIPVQKSTTQEMERMLTEEVICKRDNSLIETERCQVLDNSNEEDKLLIEIETEKSRKELDEIQKREQRLKNLENNMLDMAELQKEMYSIVANGDEQIRNIEHYVDTAEYNVEEGKVQLIKAKKLSKRWRKKKIILIGVIVGLVVVVTVIVVACLV